MGHPTRGAVLMKRPIIVLMFAVSTVGTACGENGKLYDAGPGRDATGTGIGTDVTGRVETGRDATVQSCLPACLRDFGTACVPSGTCVYQMNQSTYVTTLCWQNGVQETLDPMGSVQITVRNGGKVCYSLATDSTGALLLQDGSGASTASLLQDSANNTFTVTCTGGQPTVVDAACAGNSPVLTLASAASGNNCTTAGSCSP